MDTETPIAEIKGLGFSPSLLRWCVAGRPFLGRNLAFQTSERQRSMMELFFQPHASCLCFVCGGGCGVVAVVVAVPHCPHCCRPRGDLQTAPLSCPATTRHSQPRHQLNTLGARRLNLRSKRLYTIIEPRFTGWKGVNVHKEQPTPPRPPPDVRSQTSSVSVSGIPKPESGGMLPRAAGAWCCCLVCVVSSPTDPLERSSHRAARFGRAL